MIFVRSDRLAAADAELAFWVEGYQRHWRLKVLKSTWIDHTLRNHRVLGEYNFLPVAVPGRSPLSSNHRC
jgi:hypothetical protein